MTFSVHASSRRPGLAAGLNVSSKQAWVRFQGNGSKIACLDWRKIPAINPKVLNMQNLLIPLSFKSLHPWDLGPPGQLEEVPALVFRPITADLRGVQRLIQKQPRKASGLH